MVERNETFEARHGIGRYKVPVENDIILAAFEYSMKKIKQYNEKTKGENTMTDLQKLIDEMEKKYPGMLGEFANISNYQYNTFVEKQHDYGPGNIMLGGNVENDEDVKLALKGIVIRLNDKINRLVTLTLKGDKEPKNESVLDTFQDISVYAIIAQIVANKKWGK